ncbi:hypothetical protein BU17DRAFT_69045 [Hysterangium stoloniferum]|nr:hypothetical protein BU17DRAFT_69045 [Hysterangium stoloniferum]
MYIGSPGLPTNTSRDSDLPLFTSSGVCFLSVIHILWYFLTPTVLNMGTEPFMLPVAAVFIVQYLLSLRTVGCSHDTQAQTTTATVLSTFAPGVDNDIMENFADSYVSFGAPLGKAGCQGALGVGFNHYTLQHLEMPANAKTLLRGEEWINLGISRRK